MTNLPRPVSTIRDLIVVGGGIIGCSAAAMAAERGASVTLLEREAIGAGASGRNSGAVQHPFDPVLAELHQATLADYRALSGSTSDFAFPAEPAGLLLLTDDPAAASRGAAELSAEVPALAPAALDSSALADLEPMLAPDLAAVWLRTGYPIPPEAATSAMAQRALRAGADIRIGLGVAGLVRDGNRVSGVRLDDGSVLRADAVLVAAGPWSPDLVDPAGGWQPLRPTHGVTVQLRLARPRGPVLEEGVVHTINRPVEGMPGAEIESSFSLVSVAGTSTLGSTFLASPPDPGTTAPILVERGSRFVPALGDAPLLQSRVCVRPQSVDGRPFIGRVGLGDGPFVCVGHGPWGISTGPASAALVVDAMLNGTVIPAELRASRF